MTEYGGLIVGSGVLVDTPGQLQYGDLLMGGGTSAGWRELVGWRDAPSTQLGDSPRPQAHGSSPGSVLADSAVVTFTFQLRGTPEDKRLALATLEQHTRLDGVDRMLAVDDGDGIWYRMARTVARSIPQGKHFNHAPVECSVQWVCADPRRYALTANSVTVGLPATSGGLVYPLDYPLDYGTSSTGAVTVTNAGSEDTPPVYVFHGPLTNPTLDAGLWRLGFDITLGDGEALTVDPTAGTVLLNGTADRLYTISTASDPVESCLLPPGDTTLTLSTYAGTGSVSVTYRDARL
jgi:hypothetical protein